MISKEFLTHCLLGVPQAILLESYKKKVKILTKVTFNQGVTLVCQ